MGLPGGGGHCQRPAAGGGHRGGGRGDRRLGTLETGRAAAIALGRLAGTLVLEAVGRAEGVRGLGAVGHPLPAQGCPPEEHPQHEDPQTVLRAAGVHGGVSLDEFYRLCQYNRCGHGFRSRPTPRKPGRRVIP